MTTDAIPLITVENNQGNKEVQFVLNSKAISMIKKLPSPVKVIAAIGDARVGKSTALNFIHNKLSNPDTSVSDSKHVEQVFETGNTMQPVTHGVWIAKPNGKDNTILLDVEGTDLGDDAVTDKLSIFTALTSSTLMLFMKEAPSTHILDFLYKIVRLSEVAFEKRKSDDFPRLTAVLRGALDAPEGYKNIDEYIIHALINPMWNDESDDKRRAIGTRFPKEHIAVFNLPYDANVRKNAKSSKKVAGSEYLEGIDKLTKHILQSPEKKLLKVGILDGQTLADLIKSQLKVMNNKTLWEQLRVSFYTIIEELLCKQSYKDHIEPLLRTGHTSQDIKDKKQETMKLFREKCKLEKCIINAEHDIDDELKLLREQEKKERFMRRVMLIGTVVAAGAGIAVRAAYQFFSDVQLKENLIVLKNSEYEAIGLRGVEWVWNQQAERLGLSGRGSGVVAQEVELLYPWAVTEGYDGYKRVNYLALRLLIWAKKFQRKVEDLMEMM